MTLSSALRTANEGTTVEHQLHGSVLVVTIDHGPVNALNAAVRRGLIDAIEQFGVPLGTFQALQHRMADVLLDIEQARSATINAAAAVGEAGIECERALSAANYSIGRIGARVAEESIQLHGGMGMTWELPLSHDAKRLVMIDHQLGDEDHHLARYIGLSRASAAGARVTQN